MILEPWEEDCDVTVPFRAYFLHLGQLRVCVNHHRLQIETSLMSVEKCINLWEWW